MKKSTKLIIGILSIATIICVAAVLVFVGTGKETSEYEKYIEASQKYVDELNYEKAIAELELAIEIEPNNAEAYIALAEVYMELEDYESAIKVLEEAKGKVDDITEVDKMLNNIMSVESTGEETVEQDTDDNEINKNEPYQIRTEYAYNQDGSVWHYWVYECDETGKCIKELEYDANDILQWYWIYEYNDDGEETKWTRYASDGTYEVSCVKEYNEKRYLVKEIYSNLDGTDISYWTYEYDDEGKRIQETYYENGYLNFYILCEYDEFGKKMSYYDKNGNFEFWEYEQ